MVTTTVEEVVVGKNGRIITTLIKPEKYRNSEFDETFLMELKHTGMPEGKKLRIIIEEVE